MISIDFENKTYVCPYCGNGENFENNHDSRNVGFYNGFYKGDIQESKLENDFVVHWFRCSNKKCSKVCVTSFNRLSGKQFDILPEATYKHYPDYIPLQIRQDYEEACIIIEKSPKASATLYRRCLQGMIRNFWGIKKSRLVDEIEELQSKVTPAQWKAIDSLRKLGNIGAHMEKDVNVIVDIDQDEAQKLQKLIELLMDKWYIARHDEESLLNEIVDISDEKQQERK